MILNTTNLNTLRAGFQTRFQSGLGMASSLAAQVSTEVPSTTAKETYGWIGKIPNVREWIGERVVQNISTSDYAIANKDWELTIGVGRNDIQDDNLGIYGPLFQEMGQSTGSHKDRLVFDLLKAGFTTNCFDGQFFFDTDHPVLDKDGVMTTYANTDGGAGAPWFLMSTKGRALKPIIYQKRQDWQFVARDNLSDENVFNKKEFQFGSDARAAVGYGFPQMCWGSKQAISAANYATARAVISGMKGDYGRPLGLIPDLFVTGPAGESAARKLLNSEYAAGGESNEWKGTAELLVVPWLA